jgi:hypothetical protein
MGRGKSEARDLFALAYSGAIVGAVDFFTGEPVDMPLGIWTAMMDKALEDAGMVLS